jgi:hypothetical protein
MSSRSKKKQPSYICLSEVKASHSPKICTAVSSSVPHFLQVGLLFSPIRCRCLLKVLCLSRPITTLDCALLKDNNCAPVYYYYYYYYYYNKEPAGSVKCRESVD